MDGCLSGGICIHIDYVRHTAQLPALIKAKSVSPCYEAVLTPSPNAPTQLLPLLPSLQASCPPCGLLVHNLDGVQVWKISFCAVSLDVGKTERVLIDLIIIFKIVVE